MSLQNAVTGLLPADEGNHHAWIRDNVYCITAVWALSLAYKKAADLDEDRAKVDEHTALVIGCQYVNSSWYSFPLQKHELEQSTVKCMRGLLTAMMRQRDRIERFKKSHDPLDSIHAKFAYDTGLPVTSENISPFSPSFPLLFLIIFLVA